MKTILCLKGLYYLVTGAWPLFHMRSFLWVTGSKNDLWLVRTIAGLIVAISISLLTAVWIDPSLSTSTIVLSVAVPITFIIIDTYYVFKKIISPVYLLDAGVEIFILLSLIALFLFGYIAR